MERHCLIIGSDAIIGADAIIGDSCPGFPIWSVPCEAETLGSVECDAETLPEAPVASLSLLEPGEVTFS